MDTGSRTAGESTLTQRPGPPGQGARSGLGRDSLIVIALRLSAMVLNFALLFVMARVMSLYEFGIASTALALLNILAIPAVLGCDTAAIRYVAVFRNQREELVHVTRRLLRAVLRASTVVMLLTMAGASLEWGLGRHTLAIAFALLVPIIPTLALLRFAEGWMRGSGSIIKAQFSSSLVVPGLAIVLVAASWAVTGLHLSAAYVLVMRAIAGLAAIGVTGIFVYRRIGNLKANAPADAGAPHDMRRVLFGLSGLALLGMIATQVDILAVTWLMGARSGGIYAAASRVALAMNLAIVSVNFGLAPRAARFAHDRRALQSAATSAANVSSAIMIGGCTVLIIGADRVMALFGPAFAPGANALRILLLGQIVNGICGPVGTVMNMSGRQQYSMWTQAAADAVQLVLLVSLIPAIGLTGAAIATATANAGWNLAMAVFVRRQMGVWALPLVRRHRAG